MTDYKYSEEEKVKLHDRYYEEEGFVRTVRQGERLVPLKKIDGLFSMWSEFTEDIKKNDRYVYDVLELDGNDCIRFNVTKYDGCACTKFLMDRKDLENLRAFLDSYLNIKHESKYPQ